MRRDTPSLQRHPLLASAVLIAKKDWSKLLLLSLFECAWLDDGRLLGRVTNYRGGGQSTSIHRQGDRTEVDQSIDQKYQQQQASLYGSGGYVVQWFLGRGSSFLPSIVSRAMSVAIRGIVAAAAAHLIILIRNKPSGGG